MQEPNLRAQEARNRVIPFVLIPKNNNALMVLETMNVDSKREGSPVPSNDGGGSVPSGFILKLFQMVNGAPDEVISWTPAGDAFIIGSDLNRLESETLPQYFRHNRFQSLVRQLNFYSFRKINRERNVWIYKHKLFHRDHPEDLHMVRRRTCPGVDGRKQRFSRYSARKLSKFDGDKSSNSDDDSSLEDISSDEVEVPVTGAISRKKRTVTPEDQNDAKRSRRLPQWEGSEPSESPIEDPVIVDTSIVSDPIASPTSVFQTHETLVSQDRSEEDDSSANKKNERMEMIEQSMIVSEVATKLQEFARKAMKGRGTGRTRRGAFGVVTPPYGASSNAPISSRGLITYDDEYEKAEGVITDGDDSTASEDHSFTDLRATLATQIPRKALKELTVAPVPDSQIVSSITARILGCNNFQSHGALVASSAVASFCMTTASIEDSALCSKILRLISSCDKLSYEFQQYRAALHPLASSGESALLGHESRKNSAVSAQQIWERASSRNDAVRDFKTFAVNCITKLLGKNGGYGFFMPFSHFEAAKLQYTADVWLKSIAWSV